jgi:hypothetical protein
LDENPPRTAKSTDAQEIRGFIHSGQNLNQKPFIFPQISLYSGQAHLSAKFLALPKKIGQELSESEHILNL